MPFFPDTGFGLSYLAALCIACALAWYGGRNGARSLVAIMALHWVTMRGIDVYDHDNLWLWATQDVAMILAFSIMAKSKHWYAMACIFLVGLFCDQISLIVGADYSASAAMGEGIGYLAMMIMVGGSCHGIRLRNHGGGSYRRAADLFRMETGRKILARSRLSARDVSDACNVVSKDGVI